MRDPRAGTSTMDEDVLYNLLRERKREEEEAKARAKGKAKAKKDAGASPSKKKASMSEAERREVIRMGLVKKKGREEGQVGAHN